MSMRVAGFRPQRHAGRSSVREVCLLGVPRPEGPWTSGARVDWAGRTYRVARAQDRAGGVDDSLRYVHLKAEPRR
jgi:hypothetical protein